MSFLTAGQVEGSTLSRRVGRAAAPAGPAQARPLSQRSAGFTLVELLVVVSIIALLVAILLPSLGHARRQAKAVVCMGQMRQAGIGMTMYQSSDGSYPPHQIRMRDIYPTLAEDVRYRWFDLIAVAFGGDQMARYLTMPAAEWEEFKRGNNCFKFMNCPSTPGWDVGRNGSIGYNYKYLGSFRDNIHSANPYAPRECFPVRQVRSPAATIAFADCDGTGWTMEWGKEKPFGDQNPLRFGNHGYILDPTHIRVWSVCSYSGGELEPYSWKNWRTYLSDRHLAKAVTIFADGHGAMVDPNEAYRDNRLWNGLGLDPGLRPDGAQDPTHPLYRLDPHVAYRLDESSGQQWRYPKALSQ